MSKLTKEQIIDSYTKDIEEYLEIGLCESQANGSFGRDLIEHFNIMASYFKEIVLLEQELGIDLITFFEILNSKVCYNKKYNDSLLVSCHIWGCEKDGVIVTDSRYDYAECQYVLEWKDHKKTWALTKEELENER